MKPPKKQKKQFMGISGCLKTIHISEHPQIHSYGHFEVSTNFVESDAILSLQGPQKTKKFIFRELPVV